MNTFIPKKQDLADQKWYLVDVKDKILGKIATKIANILRGKGKPIFVPHIDCGDHVVVINAKYVQLTGNKMETKMYHKHSRYPGGLKEISAGDLLVKHPEDLVIKAVTGMLPRNKLRKEYLRKLKVFAEGNHAHEAQKPEKIEL